ncbi:CBS domain-containing protein [Dactylococcopsis salina]|uniref:Signal-transduction protein containing cAMP-binding and CBS domains n=1 Tax=Dactylococcopsis salina (strain PCC 8305) TaxID=13035 RepID=K9YV36_DACS8|nr:CBS domain-containing protein [Dactylococcopsis salina]AFZ50781.1 putative signal-transduction protein containing cAMP-binding and CBS domains [Dactylococcopsis salina PCC 8305]
MMMTAKDIMTQDVVKIKGSATIASAVNLMKERNIRCLIVDRRRDGDAYGIITETDIVKQVAAYGKDPEEMRVYEVMTKPCVVVNPDLGVEYVARLFSQVNVHHAPVIQGELLGLISTSDILRKSDFVEKPKEKILEEEIQKAIAKARQECEVNGRTSAECAVAWDVVEELQAEAAHQKAEKFNSYRYQE